MTIHTAQRGDSVYSIAGAYGVPPSRIITDNLLKDPAALSVGQDLVILNPTVTHTVRGGETLDSISAMYGVPLLKLYQNNPILGGLPNIYPGQILNIAYPSPLLGEIVSNGYAYPSINRETLRRTLPYLTYLSVFSYGIEEDGDLIEPPGNVDEVLQIASEYRTTPVLVLTSLSEAGTFSSELAARVLADEELQSRVIESVRQTALEKGYGAVDVDFEYIPAEYAEAYASFLNRMKDVLGAEIPVFVSLAPKYRADQPGLLYEAHDYGRLGAAADQVLLMTYEWGYTYGPPLAVSPLNEVRRVVDYAVTEIPANKLLLGIPNYGYDWGLPYVRGESRAQSLSNEAAVDRAGQRRAEIQYDSAAQAPFYTYYDRPETYSDAVEHIVWFENARSADAMLRLISEYGLLGAGVWNIMNYNPFLWILMNSLYSIRKLR